jgi:putative endonuclease
MGKFYYTYILQSLKDNKFYIGWTDDLKKRIDKHQQGLVKSTKNRLPIKLVYFEACLSKNKAVKREKHLKTRFCRKFLKERI